MNTTDWSKFVAREEVLRKGFKGPSTLMNRKFRFDIPADRLKFKFDDRVNVSITVGVPIAVGMKKCQFQYKFQCSWDLQKIP